VAETKFENNTPVSTVYLHSNWRGDVVMATDASGAVVGEYSYTTFGEQLSATGTYMPRFTFSSKEHDASGLVYHGFRYYSPVLCRWISEDPIRESGGLNLYQFCFNNPINRVDPYGELSAIGAYDYWGDVAGTGLYEGGFRGYSAAAGAILMQGFIDFWGARSIEENASLSGQYSAYEDCQGKAWKHGGLAAGQIALAALAAFGGNNAAHPWYRYVGPQSLPTYASGRVASGAWVVRGPAFGRNFAKATDALQLPNMPNDVIRVKGAWRQYIRYEGRATGYPQFGAGGAHQWRVP